MIQRLTEYGAENAEEWADSEIGEGIPQEARFLFLRSLWPDLILTTGTDWCPAARRAVAAGARPDDIDTAMRAAAYEAVFGLLYRLDLGVDEEFDDGAPGWQVVEAREADDEKFVSTGRELIGLHEDLLSMDPRGLEGSDLFS